MVSRGSIFQVVWDYAVAKETHTLVVWKHDQKSLFKCYVVCLPCWLSLQNETFNAQAMDFEILEILAY